MICETVMFITFSLPLWDSYDPPIVAGPFIEVRTEPRYQQPGVLLTKSPNDPEHESLLATQYEPNPQYWWVAEKPFTQMSIKTELQCTENNKSKTKSQRKR